MGRLVSPPEGLPVVSMEPLSGPRTIGAAGTQSLNGFVQTSGAAFGMWRWRFSFAPMHKRLFRRYRGWVTSLHGGANATRWNLFDPDMMTPAESGINTSSLNWWTSLGNQQDWGNGMPWSNGQGWQLSPPVVPVTNAAARGASEVRLGSAFWGHQLGVGDFLGFAPLHLGIYTVTQVIAPGRYRIWPPLRKELAAGNLATLRPTIALRLESEDAATVGRGLVMAEGLSITMIETLDYDVRQYFIE